MLANSLRRATAAGGITIGNSTISESTTTNSTSMVATVPSGVVDGDILVLIAFCDDGRNTTQASFTEVRNNTSNQPSLFIAYKVASSEPADYTLTFNSPTGGLAIMVAISGATYTSTGTIVSTLRNTTDAVANTIEAFADNSVVLFMCGSRSGATQAIPSGFTNIEEQMSAPANRPNGRLDYKYVDTGFTGAITAVNTGTERKDACAMMFTPA
jgi:hypothetical protein